MGQGPDHCKKLGFLVNGFIYDIPPANVLRAELRNIQLRKPENGPNPDSSTCPLVAAMNRIIGSPSAQVNNEWCGICGLRVSANITLSPKKKT